MALPRRDPGVYSRWVGILKIVLPLIAVGLLSTVFLVQKEDAFEGGLVFTKVDIATLGLPVEVLEPVLMALRQHKAKAGEVPMGQRMEAIG